MFSALICGYHPGLMSNEPSILSRWYSKLAANLDERRAASLYRELQMVSGSSGRTLKVGCNEYLQFCTNNYLGLADHPEVIAAAQDATGKYGLGSGASRLVAGSMELHHQLEQALAEFKQTEAALIFPSGFMANLAMLSTFAGERDLIISDKLNHASLMDAAKMSGAQHRTFPHRHYDRAATLLAHEGQLKILVTDTVFSMDGDVADLRECCRVAREHDALVMTDEAHGSGVLGQRGAGLAELQNVEDQIAASVGTLSKAFGSVGGFVCGKREVIETLINAGRTFIYTTALPPACSAGALAALRIIQREPERRARVLNLAVYVRKELSARGWDCGDSVTPIVPVMVGESAQAVAMSERLREQGIWVPAIRPPTVPPNGARLRISLMATHTEEDVARLISALGSRN